MKKRPFKLTGIIISAFLLVLLSFFIFKNQATAPTENEPDKTSEINKEATNNSQLANPASINCENLGGLLTIKTKPDGGAYGLCEFGEGMACEEWALFNNSCPQGGVDISGLEDEKQKYCLWLGGNITQTSSTCTLPDGNVCDTEALYSGTCPAS